MADWQGLSVLLLEIFFNYEVTAAFVDTLFLDLENVMTQITGFEVSRVPYVFLHYWAAVEQYQRLFSRLLLRENKLWPPLQRYFKQHGTKHQVSLSLPTNWLTWSQC